MNAKRYTKHVLLALAVAVNGMAAWAQSDSTTAISAKASPTDVAVRRLSRQQIKELHAVEVTPEKAIAITPCFPGGEKAMQAFLAEHLRYPEKAMAEGIQGDVVVSFVVDTNGVLCNIRIRKDIGGGCAPEAVRVVAEMPRWHPARNLKGEAIKAETVVPVRFAIDNMIPEDVNLNSDFEEDNQTQDSENK